MPTTLITPPKIEIDLRRLTDIARERRNRPYSFRGPSREDEMRAAFPRGITQEAMRQCDLSLSDESNLWENIIEKFKKAKSYFENYRDWTTEPLEFQRHAAGCPISVFEYLGCTFGEIGGVINTISYSGEFTDDVEHTPLYDMVLKIQSSFWRWAAFLRPSWSDIQRFWNILCDFDFGPDYEITLDRTKHYNEKGYTQYLRYDELRYGDIRTEGPWCDGTLMLVVWHKGERVFYIGISPIDKGLLLTQMQCAQKKGNRWAFKLPNNPIQHTINCMMNVCEKHSTDLFLVDGESLATKVERGYNQYMGRQEELEAYLKTNENDQYMRSVASSPVGWNTGRARVVNTYNQNLEGFERDETVTHEQNALKFVRLRRA